MSDGYKIRNQQGLYFFTFQIINWIDLFTRQAYRDIVIESMRYCQQNKGLRVHAYVIMSNHVHTIFSTEETDLSHVVRDFKTFTSKEIIRTIQTIPESRKAWILGQMAYYAKRHKRNKYYQVWTHENHPVDLVTNHFTDQKLNYIHNNPVAAGIVEVPEHYLYSSARDYCGMKGLIPVTFLD